jgi:hypothetical protein
VSKFKVGDRVRRIKHSGQICNCPIGFETTVDELFNRPRGGFWYRGADGSRQNSSSPGDWELVQPEGPVRTVTRKEIVPGRYGRVYVARPEDDFVMVGIVITSEVPAHVSLNASELRAAADTFIELADALEEGV